MRLALLRVRLTICNLCQTVAEGDLTLASQKTQFNVLSTNIVCLSNSLLLDEVTLKLTNKFQGSFVLSVYLLSFGETQKNLKKLDQRSNSFN